MSTFFSRSADYAIHRTPTNRYRIYPGEGSPCMQLSRSLNPATEAACQAGGCLFYPQASVLPSTNPLRPRAGYLRPAFCRDPGRVYLEQVDRAEKQAALAKYAARNPYARRVYQVRRVPGSPGGEAFAGGAAAEAARQAAASRAFAGAASAAEAKRTAKRGLGPVGVPTQAEYRDFISEFASKGGEACDEFDDQYLREVIRRLGAERVVQRGELRGSQLERCRQLPQGALRAVYEEEAGSPIPVSPGVGRFSPLTVEEGEEVEEEE